MLRDEESRNDFLAWKKKSGVAQLAHLRERCLRYSFTRVMEATIFRSAKSWRRACGLGLNSDASVRSSKVHRHSRMSKTARRCLPGFGAVDAVVIFSIRIRALN